MKKIILKKCCLFIAVFSLLLVSSCKDSCDIQCENSGILTIDCECVCQNGYTGEFCEEEACDIICQNGGEVITGLCRCDCPFEYTGENCEKCHEGVIVTNQQNYHAPDWQTNFTDDIEIRLPNNYIMTGVGINGVRSLLVIGRELFDDGTLGESQEFRGGPHPEETPIISYIVPDGHVITGVGFGEWENSYAIKVNYNELIVQDCVVSLGVEELYDSENPSSPIIGSDVWLRVSEINLPSRDYAFGGLGIRFIDNYQKQLETQLRKISND